MVNMTYSQILAENVKVVLCQGYFSDLLYYNADSTNLIIHAPGDIQ
jgi:hypothetical protein